MKKTLNTLLIIGILSTSNTTWAYRDISANSKLNPAIEHFQEKGILDGKGFFRAESDIPAVMFWDILLRDGGFDPEKSATFDTPLPPNVDETNTYAQIIREGVRRDFISSEEEFDIYGPLTRAKAIEHIVKAKGMFSDRLVSTSFRKKSSGVSPLARYYPYIETAHKAKLLTDNDIDPFNPNENLTRKDFITWLYQWQQAGEIKPTSAHDTNKSQNSKFQYPYQKRQSTTPANSNNVKIRVLDNNNISFTSTNESLDVKVLKSVISEIKKKYRFEDQITPEKEQQLINSAIKTIVDGLEDKYSNYVEPEKSEEFLSNLEGEFEGIGAYVEMLDEEFTITSPIKGSPAEEAGLKPGDVVEKVDGEDIAGQGIKEIINKVRGQAGTVVELTIHRKNSGIKLYKVTRGEIKIPSLTLEFKNSVAIIGVHQFSRDTGPKLEAMLENEVLPKNPRGIIVDLRNNPGGFLTAAVDVGQIFIDKNKLIFSVEYKNRNQIYKAEKRGLLADYDNIVFLQNKGSASASEILTAMVKDYGIGKIIGTPSVGKGTVQEVLSYTNGGTLKLTVAKWLSPKKNWIHEEGVIPDVEISDPTDEEKKNEVDRQLDAAVQEILRK